MNKEKVQEELTNVEFIVLEFINSGYTSVQIASFRKCSVRTVEKHRSNIIKKLNLPKTTNSILQFVIKHSNQN